MSNEVNNSMIQCNDENLEYNYSCIAKNYRDIALNLERAYEKLYKKLRANGLTIRNLDAESFTSLIHNMGRIAAIERYYTDNIQPENENLTLDSSIDEDIDINIQPLDEIILEAGDGISCREYNEILAKKINFYMRLMGYYLALKGVPISEINQAKTLNSRIDLIDHMDKILLTIFIVDIPERVFIEEYVNINYTLKGIDNQIINDGIIEVYYNDSVIKTINVGQPLRFKPVELGRGTYKFVFSRSTRYKATRVVKSINVVSENDIEAVWMLGQVNNQECLIDTNGDLRFDVLTASTNSNQEIITDINIVTDANDEPYLQYTTEEMYVDFSTMDDGIIDIYMEKDENRVPYLKFITLKTLDN